MAARLVAAGNAVGVVDVRPELQAAAAAVGAQWLGARLPVINSTYPAPTVVLTVLPGSPELREAMLGDRTGSGLIAQMLAGTLWIDMTSTAPDLAIELAIAAADHQVHYVDAALGGGPSNAEQGTLTLYVGGEDRDIHTVRSLLACLTKSDGIRHLGCSRDRLRSQIVDQSAVVHPGRSLLRSSGSGRSARSGSAQFRSPPQRQPRC